MGFRKMRFAFFPVAMLPAMVATSIAWAPLIVAALIASSGNNFMAMQAMEMTRFIFPDGQEPGLKSLARAMAAPASTSFLAGGNGSCKKNAAAGSKVQMPCHPVADAFLILLMSASG